MLLNGSTTSLKGSTTGTVPTMKIQLLRTLKSERRLKFGKDAASTSGDIEVAQAGRGDPNSRNRPLGLTRDILSLGNPVLIRHFSA